MLRPHRALLLASVFATLGLACGGTVHNETSDSGTTPPGTTPSSLAGTWDVVGGLHDYTPKAGVIVLAPDRLEVMFGEGSLVFSAPSSAPATLTWTERSALEPLAFARAASAATVDLGIIPLKLDGHIDISDPARPGAACNGDLSPTTMTAGCTGTHDSRLRDLPGLNDRIVGARTSKLASVFGELGGTWTFDNGSRSHCDASFSGSTVKLTLMHDATDEGTMTIVFSDGLATGVTNHGFEFSARRR